VLKQFNDPTSGNVFTVKQTSSFSYEPIIAH